VKDGIMTGAGWVKPILPILGRIGKRYLGNSSGVLGVFDELCTIATESR
jgi:hypothetical protein